jgi:hypothetical protein
VDYWQKSQARELLQQMMKSTDSISGNDYIIRKATNTLGDMQNCAYRRVDVIVNSNQSNITEN